MTALIDPSKPWQRVRIEAALQVLSPMHVGDGHTETFGNRKRNQALGADARNATDDETRYSTVRRDERGRPLIPGSSVRGLLRAELDAVDTEGAERLFGPVANGEALRMGMLTVRDAKIAQIPSLRKHLADYVPAPQGASNASVGADTCVAHSVAINPITGAAADHLLFSEEYVPPGSTFKLELELGPCAKKDVDTVLALLNAFDGTRDVSLGSGSSHGFGRFKIDAGSVVQHTLTADELRRWLSGGTDSEPLWGSCNPTLPDPLGVGSRPCTLALHFDSAFAVHDPGLVGRAANDKSPKIEFSRDGNGRPRIPGRSLRGLFRHRARRIIATILYVEHAFEPNETPDWAEKLVSEVLGSVDYQSGVRIGAATTSSEQGNKDRTQTFNAVDRFTGGVSDTKLYTTHLAEPATLHFDVSLSPRALRAGYVEDWWFGLGLLVLRDAIEGDFALGWGKAKGMGQLRVSYADCDTWAETLAALRKQFGPDAPQQWVDALHARIVAEIQAADAEQGDFS